MSGYFGQGGARYVYSTLLEFLTAGSDPGQQRRITQGGGNPADSGALYPSNSAMLGAVCNDALNSVVTYPWFIRHGQVSSGVGAAGNGVGMAFEAPNGSGYDKALGVINFAYSSVTQGAEFANVSMKTRSSGALAQFLGYTASTGILTLGAGGSGLTLNIDSTGNVGVGGSAVAFTGFTTVSVRSAAGDTNYDLYRAGTRAAALFTGAGPVVTLASLAGDLFLAANGTTPALRVTTQRVGIGINPAAPAYTLEVDGDINLKSGVPRIAGTAGIDAAVTTGALVGKTLTFTKGICTGFA